MSLVRQISPFLLGGLRRASLSAFMSSEKSKDSHDWSDVAQPTDDPTYFEQLAAAMAESNLPSFLASPTTHDDQRPSEIALAHNHLLHSPMDPPAETETDEEDDRKPPALEVNSVRHRDDDDGRHSLDSEAEEEEEEDRKPAAVDRSIAPSDGVAHARPGLSEEGPTPRRSSRKRRRTEPVRLEETLYLPEDDTRVSVAHRQPAADEHNQHNAAAAFHPPNADIAQASRFQPTTEELAAVSNRRQRKALYTWYERYRQLCEYKDANGDCNVPQDYPENPSLGAW